MKLLFKLAVVSAVVYAAVTLVRRMQLDSGVDLDDDEGGLEPAGATDAELVGAADVAAQGMASGDGPIRRKASRP